MIRDIFDTSKFQPEEIEGEELSSEEIMNNIPTQSDEQLADIVVSFRYLGLNKELSIAAMNELAKRRLNSNDFQYEKYIQDKLNTMPKIEMTIPAVSSLLDQLKKFKKS